MRPLISLSFATILAASLSGCIYVDGQSHDSKWQSHQIKNRDLINNLDLDTEHSTVLRQLGTPDFSEAFMIDNEKYRILYYRTQHRHSDGDTSKDETTPLVFKDDRLVGWGQTMLNSLNR